MRSHIPPRWVPSPCAHAPEGGGAPAAAKRPTATALPPGVPVALPTGLTDRILAYAPNADVALIGDAYAVAARAHGEQKRDNGDPYITHPLAVADILASYRLDVASVCTALLHDTVEDTGVTLPQIERQFGGTIAGLVDGVTKLTRLELQSDRDKQAENFRKLVLAMSRDIRVLLVKLADRLHNMRTLQFVTKSERQKRIARETMDIYAPLAARIGMDAMKTELQTRAFAVLDPEAYGTIQARLNYLRGQGADVIEAVRRELGQVCRDNGVEVLEVSGREKSAFSIWEKMQRRNVAFEQLSDIMAFRIVVPTREQCYMALGAIHNAYPVIAGRFKDYISTPKANGYRSLHTGVTLRQPHNQKIEIQIRTRDMHDVADNGVAAHWNYKEGDRELPDEIRKFRWVQDLLEILDDSAAGDDFMADTKLQLYQDQVFCFTPKGQLIQLPRGATPIDFAYAVHSQVGDTCVGAKVNGRLTPLRHELQNGDQVEIMTARGGTPSPSWERWVVTGKARARIRRYVAQQQRAQTLDQGRGALARAFRQEGLDGSEKVLEAALKGLKCASLDDLYVAVGGGHIGPKDVVHATYPEMKAAARGPRHMPTLLTRHGTARAPARDTGMAVTGLVAGMAVHYAGCCHPLPGDRIVGIVTTGKGVTIHTNECPTLETFAATPERFIDVDWDYANAARGATAHTGRISVIATNETDTLGNLTNAVSRHEGSVSNLKIMNRQQDFMEVLLDVGVRDTSHLANVIAGLRAVKGISQVERAQG
jgi:GTP pyrophosphokinase